MEKTHSKRYMGEEVEGEEQREGGREDCGVGWGGKE